MIEGVGPGTILAVRSEGVFSEAIRFGSALIDKPNVEAHIAVVHHKAADGTIWGIEGRPGGCGWVDCGRYLNAVYTISNRNQPLTPQQREEICQFMEILAFRKAGYDWPAIFQDAERDLHLPELWTTKWNGEVPCHIVCSSGAAWVYDKVGALRPEQTDDRHVQPADWTEFILTHHFE